MAKKTTSTPAPSPDPADETPVDGPLADTVSTLIPTDDLSGLLGFPDPLHIRLPLGDLPTEAEAASAYAERVKAQVELYKAGLDLRDELAKRAADIAGEQLDAQRKRLELAALARKDAEERASDAQALVYTFYDDVREESIKDAMATIGQWARRAPGAPIEVVLNSPGGHVIDGLALFDFLRGLSAAGHRVTVTAHGMAASMGGILLQAGDERVIGKNAFLLIHEVRGGAHGTTSGLTDELEFFQLLETRLLAILAQRSTMTVEEIREKWERRDWWLTSEQAVELGFADRVA